ncbi:MAG: HAD family hydrolase [Eubacteriales bacterium]|nr:HAD family hydrolase [Eubacteriales bacterium]MDD3882708.1 HAD family hydrolase [Eubacteriales bacterium]MDD4512671.1 HAD family hydrolase [Eubacteriales bacterium]
MFEAVVFDLDGTLLNTLDDIADSVNFALNAYGFPEHLHEEYKYFVGNGVDKLIERALGENNSPCSFTKVKAEYLRHYDSNRNNLTKPYDGIEEALSAMEGRGIKLLVLSNKPEHDTSAMIPRHFPSIHFSLIRGGRDGVPVKPNPQAVNEMLSELSLGRQRVLYVGDSGVDMETAKNAELKSCGVIWGFRTEKELRECGACHIARNPQELLKFALEES